MRISDWSSDVCSSDLVGDALLLLERLVGVLGLEDLGIERLVPTVRGAPNLLDAGPEAFCEIASCDSHFSALLLQQEIGRASCRERVCQYVSISLVAASFKKKINQNIYNTK